MKRLGNLYGQIYSIENLELADKKARKGKKKQYGVKVFDKNREKNIFALQQMLIDRTYRTSGYNTFTLYDPKERQVYCLPYFPDRIAHHAVMNVLEPVFNATFTANTFSCIKGKGIHAASLALRKALRDEKGTQYCLKLDVKKFYPSIDHNILKQLLRRKFKDLQLLSFLDEIIDSAPGIPIGNYLSQYFANFYLSYFDHWIKEQKGVKYYFRYADDLVFLSDSKDYLHNLLKDVNSYLEQNLKLTLKSNYQVFPVSCGIDFVGYVHYHTHTRLRKTIKKSFARMIAKNPNVRSLASYWGWAKHCNSKTLLNKLLYDREGNCIHLQRTKHSRSRIRSLRWRQNKNRQNSKQRNSNLQIQN